MEVLCRSVREGGRVKVLFVGQEAEQGFLFCRSGWRFYVDEMGSDTRWRFYVDHLGREAKRRFYVDFYPADTP